MIKAGNSALRVRCAAVWNMIRIYSFYTTATMQSITPISLKGNDWLIKIPADSL